MGQQGDHSNKTGSVLYLFSMRYGGCSASFPTVIKKDAPLSDTSTGKMQCCLVAGLWMRNP